MNPINKKPKNEYYFDDTVEYWAQEFAKLNNGPQETFVERMARRNEIYRMHLAAPFYQLAIRIIHTYRLYYFDLPPEEVAHDAVGFAMTKFSKYIPGKAKAFSFFSTVIKRYLINGHNGNWRKYHTYMSIDANTDDGESFVVPNEQLQVANKRIQDNRQIMSEIEYFQERLQKCGFLPRETAIAQAIIQVMKDANDVVNNAHKRIIYSMIRNIADGASSSEISKCLAKMKKMHWSFVKQYREEEGNYD